MQIGNRRFGLSWGQSKSIGFKGLPFTVSDDWVQELREMEESEFRRLLDLFPVVRSRHYNAEELKPSTSRSSQVQKWQDVWSDEGDCRKLDTSDINLQDEFWKKLKSAAEKKLGWVDAERFCKAFQKVYKKIVFEELSLEAARGFLSLSKS